LKPGIESFDRLIQTVGIRPRDKVVFFEDTIENLITSKGYNWITVLISPRKNLLPEVDFCFPNCNVALNFFLMEIVCEKNRQNAKKRRN
jgi:FMN phosphatase YigB (HAD superfamily)